MAGDLIVVRQLPVIEDNLRAFKGQVEQRVRDALALTCTEANYKEIKKVRSELGKEFKLLEDQRKQVKKSILAPYDAFEAVYKDCAGDLFTKADQELKRKIDSVESGIKQERTDEITAFFEEYRESKGIEAGFTSFEKSKIPVNMSTSRKKLQEQVMAYLDRIADDLALIATMEHADEILYEYRWSLNVSQAATTVDKRYKALAAERQRKAAAEEAARARAENQVAIEEVLAENRAESVLPPPVAEPTPAPDAAPTAVPVPPTEKKYITTFKVRGTLNQLKELKAFLIEGEYEYEC